MQGGKAEVWKVSRDWWAQTRPSPFAGCRWLNPDRMGLVVLIPFGIGAEILEFRS